MKVFISHSSRDKWIARKLSEEIITLGCETFLDEKDIRTGESIDEAVHDHLVDSDDFLLLLSPDSIKSHWVLIELGGALALKKRIIIVLLYLGSNDIPQPISKHLARDINEIDKYYSEVKKRLSGKKVKQPPKKLIRRKKVTPKQKFKIGDRVRIISKPQSDTNLIIGWNEDMDQYCGQLATVSRIMKEEGLGFVHIQEDDGEWGWAFDWIKHES